MQGIDVLDIESGPGHLVTVAAHVQIPTRLPFAP